MVMLRIIMMARRRMTRRRRITTLSLLIRRGGRRVIRRPVIIIRMDMLRLFLFRTINISGGYIDTEDDHDKYTMRGRSIGRRRDSP